ncbi:MAG: hypothetical protein E7673_00260 [Ruminococcaceae bacterium]|nr:hypothetical protein [Oscillospiraceae bacterium]
MKSIYKSLISILLLLAITLSSYSCIPSNSTDNDNDGNQSENGENNGGSSTDKNENENQGNGNTHTHVMSEWEIEVAVTCTSDGQEISKCTVDGCEHILINPIKALGHSLVDVSGKDATCDEPGYKDYVMCTRCTYDTYELIPAKNHDYTVSAEKNPDGDKCINCGGIHAHAAYGDWYTIKKADCTSTGIDEHKCAVCNATERKTTPKLNHSYDENGKCAVCGKSDTDSENDDTHTHVMSEWETEIAVTCTADGQEIRKCTVDGCTHTEINPIKALGHRLVDVSGKSATCDEPGYKDYVMCTRCTYDTYEIIPAKNHDYTVSAEKNPDGDKCINCGGIHSHTTYESWYTVKKADCTSTGIDEHKCAVCNATERKTTPKLDHSYSASGKCTVCGAEQPEASVPDSEKLNTIEASSLPFYSYAYGNANAYNKELFYKNSYQVPLGDPTVLPKEENGEMWFYVTGTTTGSSFEMWKTKNFSEWEKIGTVYSPGENFFGKSSFWAPQLFYDAEADWQYYLGESSESGKGLYILFFSARRTTNACALSVAFSKNIEGPYTNFVGTNANGDYVDETNSCFEVEELKSLNLYANHTYGNLYKKDRSFIDACPFVDPVTGDKYLYMVRNRNVDTTNDVWGVKMKDWVSPDYKTTTPLTSYGYTDINKTAPYGYMASATNKIDEGPFLVYKDYTDDGLNNGKYYLTFSIGGTSDKLYPVCQAIGESPLGPFTKIQPEYGGMLNVPEMEWDIHGSGHHAFFEVDGELYVAYHSYEIKSGNSIGRRYLAINKVEWVYNEKGEYIMRSNGPSMCVQPLPEAISGYYNVAKDATVTVNGLPTAGHSNLNDGIIALREGDENLLFSYTDDTTITLSFKDYVNARAILIYNSYDYKTAFSSIQKIELCYRKLIDGRIYYGTAVIDYVDFNFQKHLIPASYLKAQGETNMYQLRPASAAIVEFDDIEVNCIKIHMVNRNTNSVTSLSDIFVLGKKAEIDDTDKSLSFGGYTHEPVFDSYTLYNGEVVKNEKTPEDLISIDGKLTDKIWTELATVTVIEGATVDATTKEPVDVSVYGEREAKVYTYIGKRKIYFAFDVTDKNLYFNAESPQGRSTCVEIYFTAADNTSLLNNCYSIRINPTGEKGELSCNLGIYVQNAAGNEWRYSEIAHNVKAVALVNGSVQTSEDQTDYDPSKNVGYTVEIEIDKILIGLEAESFRFTAAFVQDKGFNEPRINNTFIPGTHYIKPETWIVFTNKDAEGEQ